MDTVAKLLCDINIMLQEYMYSMIQLTDLDKNTSFVVSKSDIVRPLEHGHTPHSFKTVIKGALQSVSIGLPNANSAYRVQ